MNRLLLSLLFILCLSSAALAEPVKVILETSKGNIELALDQDKAPLSVANFLRYADEGFYNNTIFGIICINLYA